MTFTDNEVLWGFNLGVVARINVTLWHFENGETYLFRNRICKELFIVDEDFKELVVL